ncbi:MAG: hypothetical protein WC657_03055 [Candidatus Paceibacterota bacterium]|jgi:hypothetical protein
MQEKPLYFYVANLGSEIQRIFVWKEKGDIKAMQNAHDRAVSIINTIKKFGNKNANAEMDILIKSVEGNVLSRNQISSYFNPFALRITNNF